LGRNLLGLRFCRYVSGKLSTGRQRVQARTCSFFPDIQRPTARVRSGALPGSAHPPHRREHLVPARWRGPGGPPDIPRVL